MQSDQTINLSMGQAVRGALAQAGMKQAEAAPKLELSLISLSRRINGALPFTWPELVRVARVTGVPIPELVATSERLANRDQVPA